MIYQKRYYSLHLSFLLAILVLSCLGTLCAPSTCAESADSVLGFADSLFQEEDYLNAVQEYERFLLLFPVAKERPSVEFRIAASYRNAGQLNEAIQQYERLREPGGRIAAYAEMKLAETYLLAGDAQKAVDVLALPLRNGQVEDLLPRAQLLHAMGETELRHWNHAMASLRLLASMRPATEFSRLATDLVPMTAQGGSLPHRSGLLSGMLSAAIPGLGQASNGHWANAAWSFVSVGGLGVATAYYVDEERYSVGIPLALATLAFHVNNVRVASRSAQAYNAYHEHRLMNQIRTQIRESGAFQPKLTRSSRF